MTSCDFKRAYPMSIFLVNIPTFAAKEVSSFIPVCNHSKDE
jgi:hypothetical protein